MMMMMIIIIIIEGNNIKVQNIFNLQITLHVAQIVNMEQLQH